MDAGDRVTPGAVAEVPRNSWMNESGLPLRQLSITDRTADNSLNIVHGELLIQATIGV